MKPIFKSSFSKTAILLSLSFIIYTSQSILQANTDTNPREYSIIGSTENSIVETSFSNKTFLIKPDELVTFIIKGNDIQDHSVNITSKDVVILSKNTQNAKSTKGENDSQAYNALLIFKGGNEGKSDVLIRITRGNLLSFLNSEMKERIEEVRLSFIVGSSEVFRKVCYCVLVMVGVFVV